MDSRKLAINAMKHIRPEYVCFVLACALFVAPLTLSGPVKSFGYRGGSSDEVMSATDLLVYYLIICIVLAFSGRLSLVSFFKDYWSARGSIQNRTYRLSLTEPTAFHVKGIKGKGMAFLEITLHLLNYANHDDGFRMNVVFAFPEGKARARHVELGPLCHEEHLEFAVIRKNKWVASLEIVGLGDATEGLNCEMNIKSYSAVGSPVFLPAPETISPTTDSTK